jgi:hypothetical protein
MSGRRHWVSAILILAATCLSIPAGAWAHGGAASGALMEAPIEAPALAAALSAAPAEPGWPWAALAGVLATVLAAWRRPRRALGLALVLLLALFAFEGGLHSVHHGLGKSSLSTCPIAAASLQLSATGVGEPAAADVILLPTGRAAEFDPVDPAIRPPCPDQGRAPPSATV